MACSLARRAARLAIFVLRRLGQRSGNRSPKSKKPPQAGARAIGSQAEGEADRARGGGTTGDLISVGVRTPRTDKHLLQLLTKRTLNEVTRPQYCGSERNIHTMERGV